MSHSRSRKFLANGVANMFSKTASALDVMELLHRGHYQAVVGLHQPTQRPQVVTPVVVARSWGYIGEPPGPLEHLVPDKRQIRTKQGPISGLTCNLPAGVGQRARGARRAALAVGALLRLVGRTHGGLRRGLHDAQPVGSGLAVQSGLDPL